MAIRQVTVPWIRGYDFGVGADLASGSPMGMAVAGAATPVENAQGGAVDIQVQRIHSTEELEHALGIDAEASYGCASFGAGIGGRFSFAKNSKIQVSSLFMSITVQLELEFHSIDDPALSPGAAEVIGRPDVFTTRYGNMFVRGIGRGGLFVGVLRVDTTSSKESTDIAAELGGSYGLFSADLDGKFKDVMTKYHNEIFVQMYHEGGPINLNITNPGDPLELLNNANLFLQSFSATPEKFARPYFVTLAPISIARGPQPPNTAQLEHAQDVLVYCAKRRSALLDQLNLLDFITDNPARFNVSKDPSPSALTEAAQNFQADLDIIAECASLAINDPANATMPAEFATIKHTTFPKGALPNPMPEAKSSAATVPMPDFHTCTTWAACCQLAESKGLKLIRKYQGDTIEAFRVIDFYPPKDAPVTPGVLVTIVCPPIKSIGSPSEKAVGTLVAKHLIARTKNG
ncbi:hypothetical protein [Corallococcus exercitus]|uniref:PASTA domain-containing protein n=1 Tax=Corallococcus exercitus TaxID=2316736 RepID=A0A7Y4JW67_9BACT|nr:hypothetical protein [Corallococcus exercitus]NOK12289.1 hypothetical protein [Corallococcus exercitus]